MVLKFRCWAFSASFTFSKEKVAIRGGSECSTWAIIVESRMWMVTPLGTPITGLAVREYKRHGPLVECAVFAAYGIDVSYALRRLSTPSTG